MSTALNANVDTARGKVKLTGTADSAEAKEAAGKLAMNTRGVHSVNNQLVVEAAKPGVAKTMRPRRCRRRLDHHESEIDLHVLQQREWFRYRGQHQWRHRHADAARWIAARNVPWPSSSPRNVRGVKSVDSTSLTM